MAGAKRPDARNEARALSPSAPISLRRPLPSFPNFDFMSDALTIGLARSFRRRDFFCHEVILGCCLALRQRRQCPRPQAKGRLRGTSAVSCHEQPPSFPPSAEVRYRNCAKITLGFRTHEVWLNASGFDSCRQIVPQMDADGRR